MTAQAYNIISVSSFVLCGFTLSLSIFLFFKLRIRSVIGELSGKTAERQVEEIRKQNRTIKKRASILMDEPVPSLESTDVLEKNNEIQDEATVALSETTLLMNDFDENATVLLSTDILKKEEYITLVDVMEIHTQEVIMENR